MKKQMTVAEWYDYKNAGRKKYETAYNTFMNNYCKIYGLSIMKEVCIIYNIALKELITQVK